MANRRTVKTEAVDEIPSMQPAAKTWDGVVHAPEETVEIIDDVEQNSEEWFALRLGLVTASNFSKVLAGGEGLSREKLLRELAGEIVTGQTTEGFKNAAMARGNAMEDDIRNAYCLDRAVEVERVGFVRRTIRPGFVVGCSPDSLVMKSQTVVEIKSLNPAGLIDLWKSGRFPTQHTAQCQGALWVTGWPQCDLVIGYRGWPKPLIYQVQRNEDYIAQLARAVEVFDWEVRKLAGEIKKWGAG